MDGRIKWLEGGTCDTPTGNYRSIQIRLLQRINTHVHFPVGVVFFFILFERRRQEEFALREMKPTVGGRGATSLHRAAPFNFNIDLFNLFVLSKVDQIVVYSDWIAKQVPNFKLNIDNQICRCRYSASIQLQLKHSNTHSKRITQIVIK